jgi:hypothetical protein
LHWTLPRNFTGFIYELEVDEGGRLLMIAWHVDLDELDKRVRVGWERRRGATSEFGFDRN